MWTPGYTSLQEPIPENLWKEAENTTCFDPVLLSQLDATISIPDAIVILSQTKEEQHFQEKANAQGFSLPTSQLHPRSSRHSFRRG